MKLLIIGQGAWASKIQSVLTNLSSGIYASTVSARAALEDSSKIFEISRDSEVIWICTKPEWQLELLPKFAKFKGKLILEKPYIVDELSVHQISEFLNIFKGVLQISEPWTFSNIWGAAKNEIKETSNLEFTISRGGPTGHDFMSAVMDWLPHDINLLFDLYGSELMKSEVSDIHWEDGRSELQFQVSVRSGIKFTIKIGNFEGQRIAKWVSKDLKINFGNSTLTRGNTVVNVAQGKNPFLAQIEANWQDSTSRTQRQLEVQNYFFKQLLI